MHCTELAEMGPAVVYSSVVANGCDAFSYGMEEKKS